MLLSLQNEIKKRITAGANELFGVTIDDPVIEIPKDVKHGEFATPVGFDIAKRIKADTGEKRVPRDLATALAEWLRSPEHAIDGILTIEIAGPGYINFKADQAVLLAAFAAGVHTVDSGPADEKVLVEHTSVNPNKAAHIGHLRNAVLGDSVARLLRRTGHNVEVHNWIDNTGVQVADVVVGFLYVEQLSFDEIKAIADPFDHYCWDLYSRVGLWYRDADMEGKENPEKLAKRNEVLHAIESGHGPIAEMGEYVANRNLEALLKTMLRFGIQYDVMPRESEVVRCNFWADAFELLKASGVMYFAEEGKHAGCWVMKADDGATTLDEDEGQHAIDKILVKSNGLVTYTGKDIAYHLWKLNRIDRDFDYRPFTTYPDGHTVWMTAPTGEGQPDHPTFGHGYRYINVIDVGQSYVQEFVKRAVMAVTNDPRVAESTHLNYEKVGLTVATCDALGLKLGDDERGRSFVGMAGRKGRGVKVDDLIALLEKNALTEVKKRARGYPEDEEHEIARIIAVGALRYFLLKYTRNSVIAFDFEEALKFEGETGPYIQNAAVRLKSIFTKLEELGIETRPLADLATADEVNALLAREENAEFWPLIYRAGQLSEVLDRSAAALEPAIVAKYAFEVAQKSNQYYHAFLVMREQDETRRALMIATCALVRETLVVALGVLGITVPTRM